MLQFKKYIIINKNESEENLMEITKDIRYVGVNDHKIDLFEGQYDVPNGMAYNSYVILDSKIAVMDTVDRNFTHEWLNNLEDALGDRKPDYLVVQHMEPDHSANIFRTSSAPSLRREESSSARAIPSSSASIP